MCYINMNSCQMKEEGLLPPEKWKWLADQAKENGMMRVSLTGGECLTYPGFDEVYTYLYQQGFMIQILSNGILMDTKRISFLRQYPPKLIKITLYGGSEDEYEMVTGHRQWERICRNIRAIRDAGLPIVIVLTPNPFTKENSNHILECVDEFCVPYSINSALIPPRENTGRRGTFDIRNDPFIEMCKAQCARKQVTLKPVERTSMPDPGQTTGEIKRGLLCAAGKSTFTILYDGKMCPCSGMDEIIVNPLKDGFRNAWEELKAKTDACIRPAECDGCAYEMICLGCTAIHKEAPKGHCDRRICERTIQMVQEGLWRKPEDWKGCIE